MARSVCGACTACRDESPFWHEVRTHRAYGFAGSPDQRALSQPMSSGKSFQLWRVATTAQQRWALRLSKLMVLYGVNLVEARDPFVLGCLDFRTTVNLPCVHKGLVAPRCISMLVSTWTGSIHAGGQGGTKPRRSSLRAALICGAEACEARTCQRPALRPYTYAFSGLQQVPLPAHTQQASCWVTQ